MYDTGSFDGRWSVLGHLSDEVVFSIGAAQYRLPEIVQAARVWGILSTLEETVRLGIACLNRAAEIDSCPTDAEIEAAGSAFRYDRDLITAEEMQVWLERWGVTVETWTDYLQRELLRERWAEEPPEDVTDEVVSQEEIDEVLHVEGICSGEYRRTAHKLAAALAAHERARDEGWLGVDPGPAGNLPDFARLEAAVDALRVRTVTPAAVKAEVIARQLDWVRLDCEVVSFADLPRAREAVLCVRDDGRELAEVAAEAKSVVDRETFCLEEVEPAWRDRLLAARAGDLVGPLGRDDAFVLIRVCDKVLPAPDDPDVHQRAEASLLDRALEQEISNRVKWHHPL